MNVCKNRKSKTIKALFSLNKNESILNKLKVTEFFLPIVKLI